MFRRRLESGETVAITVDGRAVRVAASDTVAAALLACGVEACRIAPVSGAPRAPYCMMGVCFECSVTIDGQLHRQGCLVRVREGMRVETQRRPPT